MVSSWMIQVQAYVIISWYFQRGRVGGTEQEHSLTKAKLSMIKHGHQMAGWLLHSVSVTPSLR